MPPPWISRLVRILGPRIVKWDLQILESHASDKWFARHLPDVVVMPTRTSEVACAMAFAHQEGIPVTARGAGVGYVGGCVPMKGGMVLSLAGMKRILEINPVDGVAVVEPGVITGVLQSEVKKAGFFYPPDPASLKECTLGGNIATNAGGPRCLKYGVTRHYVLGLEVVTAEGKVVQLGGRTHKNKTGFDLAGLFVGSEGMLGLVTKAILRIIPHPEARAGVSAGFRDEAHSAQAVQEIFKNHFLPSALEITDRFTLQALRARADRGDLPGKWNLPEGNSHLLIEVDGTRMGVREQARRLGQLLKKLKARSVDVALTEESCERIWEIRRECSQSLKLTGLKKLNEDITIPRSRLVDLFAFARTLQKRHRIPIACFGHAGDGNIHVNVMINPHDQREVSRSEIILDQLFRKVIGWKGAITGEHGVGLAKKRWWKQALSPEARRMHEVIKLALDPKHTLNPDKFLEGKRRRTGV